MILLLLAWWSGFLSNDTTSTSADRFVRKVRAA